MRTVHRRSSAILALGTAVLISAGSRVIGERNSQIDNAHPPVGQRSGIAVQETTPKMEQHGLTATSRMSTL
jgi:hypothetical protein